MFETLCSSLVLVFSKLLNIPSQIFFNLCVLVEYYEIELENIKVSSESASSFGVSSESASSFKVSSESASGFGVISIGFKCEIKVWRDYLVVVVIGTKSEARK